MKTPGRFALPVQAISLVIMLGLATLILGPMKREADRQAHIIKTRILTGIEEQFDVDISYGGISPALLSVITVRDLRVDFGEGTFETERLRIFYNPLKQFGGDSDDPARVISRVAVSDASLVLNLVEKNSTADPGASDPGGSFLLDTDFLTLMQGKSATMSNLDVRINAPGMDYAKAEVEQIDLKYDGDDVRYEVTGSASAVVAEAPGLGNITGKVSSSGRFSPENVTLNGRLELMEAETALVGLRPMSIDLTLGRDNVVIRRVGDEKPVDVSARLDNGNWVIEGETRNLPVSDLLVPAAGSAAYAEWFGSYLDGVFNISGSLADESLDYTVDLAVSRPGVEEDVFSLGNLVASGNRDRADVEGLYVENTRGNVRFTGEILIDELMPVGLLELNIDDEITGYPVNAAFRTSYSNSTLVANPVNVAAGDTRFDEFSFLLIRDQDLLTASLLARPAREGDTEARKILVDVLVELSDDPVVHAFLSLEGIHGTIPARLAGIDNPSAIPVLRDSVLNMKGFYEANRNSWVLNVDEASVVSTTDRENGLSFSGRVFPDRWALDGLHLEWNEFELDGRVFAIRNDEGGDAEGTFLLGDQIIPLSGSWYNDGRMELESSEGLSMFLGPRSASGRTLLVNASDFTVPIESGDIISNLDIRGRLVPGNWELFVNTAELDIRREELSTLVTSSGTIGPGAVVLSNISVADSSGILKGNASFNSRASGRSMNGRLYLSSDSGESYEIVVTRDGDLWGIELYVDSALLRRFAPERLAGTADISGSLSGTIADPELSLSISSEDGILDGRPFTTRANAEIKDRKLRVRDLLYDNGGLVLNRGLILADLESGAIRSTADLNGTFNQVPLSSGFSLAVDFNKRVDFESVSDIASGDFSGTLASRPVRWNTREHLPAFTFQFSRVGDDLTVRTPDGETLDLAHNRSSGEFSVVSRAPLPVMASGSGRILDDWMDVSLPSLAIDPQLINYVMLRDPLLLEYHVVFQEGLFDGSLDIVGPINDPDMFGSLAVRDLKVDTPYTYSDIQPTDSEIVFDGDRISIDLIEIPIGDGFVYAKGYLALNRWSISEWDMVYGGRAGRKGDGVPIYYPLMGVTLDGTFTGEIRMQGDGQSYSLDGRFVFPDLKASLSTPLVPVSQRKEGKPPKPVYLNIDFVTGNNVTFFLPNEQLKIVRATAEPGGVLNFNYTTVPQVMSISGDLPIKSGNIYYFDRDFQVTQGEMAFNETLGSFDPILDFRAETRVRDERNEDITVALVYNAPVKSDFNPQVETVPARTDREILELFGQVVAPFTDADSSEGNAVLLATGSVFAQAGIVQPFEEVIREGLNLDMVTLRTDIIENTLTEGLGRGDDTEVNTLDSGLGRYLDNTSLFAGKYIGEALFVSGSVSANYFEEQRNRSVFGGLQFTAAVSLEMETPFFNVAWSYSPDPTISGTRNFVEDNEISLKWQFSF